MTSTMRRAISGPWSSRRKWLASASRRWGSPAAPGRVHQALLYLTAAGSFRIVVGPDGQERPFECGQMSPGILVQTGQGRAAKRPRAAPPRLGNGASSAASSAAGRSNPASAPITWAGWRLWPFRTHSSDVNVPPSSMRSHPAKNGSLGRPLHSGRLRRRRPAGGRRSRRNEGRTANPRDRRSMRRVYERTRRPRRSCRARVRYRRRRPRAPLRESTHRCRVQGRHVARICSGARVASRSSGTSRPASPPYR